jgi:hypothetical protein
VSSAREPRAGRNQILTNSFVDTELKIEIIPGRERSFSYLSIFFWKVGYALKGFFPFISVFINILISCYSMIDLV